MRSRHVETKSTLILCPKVSDPGKYVCVDDHLLQLIDQPLDLGLGAKSWPAACLHPVHCVEEGYNTIQDGLSDPCSDRKARSSQQGQQNNPQKAKR